MTEKYDFANLSPVEFESLCVDLVSAETGLNFERFSAGADGGIDGRHSSSNCKTIIQAKHYKNSTWSDLQTAAKNEHQNIVSLSPTDYIFVTSQSLTPAKKDTLKTCLNHISVKTSNIWGRAELNALLQKHERVERQNIKLWLSSSAVLQKLLNNDIAVFTEGTRDEIERILKVYVTNPSLSRAAQILKDKHCVTISGSPGVGKTTLAQVLAAEYCDEEWSLVAISSIDAGLKAFKDDENQVFVFDDFLGKIKLSQQRLAQDDGAIARFLKMISKRSNKRFILTSRAYILQAARDISEAIDDRHFEITEMVLDLALYTREIKARILYNHLYHSELKEDVIQALLSESTVHKIVDHPNYMPRIIEWMTDYHHNNLVTPEEYPVNFIETLNNPQKIWEKAFYKHISLNAQVLLYCMFFSRSVNFPTAGIRIEELKPFFEKAVINFGVCEASQLRSNLLENAIREVKSSFVVIDDEVVKFINPSILDFLNKAVEDIYVFRLIVQSISSFASAKKALSFAKQSFREESKVQIANLLLDTTVDRLDSWRQPLNEWIDFVGDLVLITGRAEIITAMRNGEYTLNYWIIESELPALISELTEGVYCDLPFSQSFVRYLRRELHNYIVKREYVLDLEEVGAIAEELTNSFYEFSDEFHEAFTAAAYETIDSLDIAEVRRGDDPEGTVSEWLENIEKIESYSENAVDSFRKNELEEFLAGLNQYYEMQLKKNKEDRSLNRSSTSRSDDSPSSGVRTSRPHFSDTDISSMFSSLKKQK